MAQFGVWLKEVLQARIQMIVTERWPYPYPSQSVEMIENCVGFLAILAMYEMR